MAAVKNMKQLVKDLGRTTKIEAKVKANTAAQKQGIFSKIADIDFVKNGDLKKMIPGQEVTQYAKRELTPELVDEARNTHMYSKKVIADGTKQRNRGKPLHYDMGNYGGASGTYVDGYAAKAMYEGNKKVADRFDSVIEQVNKNANNDGSFYYGPQNIREKVKSYYSEAENGKYRKNASLIAGAAIGGTAIGINTAHRFMTGGDFRRDGNGKDNILNVPFI